MGDVRAIKPLKRLLKDNSIYVRSHAIHALCGFQDVSLIEQLFEIMKLGDWSTCYYAKQAFIKMGVQTAITLNDEFNKCHCPLRYHVIEVLLKLESPTTSAFLEVIEQRDVRFARLIASMRQEIYWSNREVQILECKLPYGATQYKPAHGDVRQFG